MNLNRETQPQTQSLSVYRVYHPEFNRLQLYGGEYPYSSDDIEEFIGLGITTSISLAEDIFTNYPNEVRTTDFKLLHYPIRDFSVPSNAFMTSILDTIDDLIVMGETIYVHCLGGHGRTGTVIGCWLKRHGFRNEQVYAKLSHWRRQTLFGNRQSPEGTEQIAMIDHWQNGS